MFEKRELKLSSGSGRDFLEVRDKTIFDISVFFIRFHNILYRKKIRRGITLALLFFYGFYLSGCVSPGATTKDYADLHFRVGSAHLEKGNFPEALKELLQAESYKTNNPLIYNNLGMTYFMLERYEQSEINFKKAISLNPNFTEGRNNLSRVLVERGKYREAREQIKKVLEDLTYTQPAKVFINLGLSYFKEQKYSESREAFLKAVNYDRENCLAQSYYGRSLLEMKELQRSIQVLDKASAYCLKVNFDEPIYFSAIAYYRMGDSMKARARLEALVQKNSSLKDKAESMLEILRK